MAAHLMAGAALLMAAGVVILLIAFPETRASLADPTVSGGLVLGCLPAADFVAWVSVWSWAPGFTLLLTATVLLFPDGQPPSPRWRPVLWVAGLALSMNAVAVAGSTLAVASLFQPLRRRVQQAVDRRFDRARYDGERVVSMLSARLRDETDLALVGREIETAVRKALAPSSSTVWMRSR